MDHPTYDLFAREERDYDYYPSTGRGGCRGCLIIALAPFVALGTVLMILEALGIKV